MEQFALAASWHLTHPRHLKIQNIKRQIPKKFERARKTESFNFASFFGVWALAFVISSAPTRPSLRAGGR
jgi:hypothetical protein